MIFRFQASKTEGRAPPALRPHARPSGGLAGAGGGWPGLAGPPCPSGTRPEREDAGPRSSHTVPARPSCATGRTTRVVHGVPASPGALGEGRLPQTRTPTCSGQVRLLAENLPAPELSAVGVGNRPAATGLASNEERGANPGRQRPAGRPMGTRAAGGGPSEKEPGAREGSFWNWNVVAPRDLSLTGGLGDRVGGSGTITQATRSPFSKPSPLRPAPWPGDTETFQSLLLASRPDIGPGASDLPPCGADSRLGLTGPLTWALPHGPRPARAVRPPWPPRSQTCPRSWPFLTRPQPCTGGPARGQPGQSAAVHSPPRGGSPATWRAARGPCVSIGPEAPVEPPAASPSSPGLESQSDVDLPLAQTSASSEQRHPPGRLSPGVPGLTGPHLPRSPQNAQDVKTSLRDCSEGPGMAANCRAWRPGAQCHQGGSHHADQPHVPFPEHMLPTSSHSTKTGTSQKRILL